MPFIGILNQYLKYWESKNSYINSILHSLSMTLTDVANISNKFFANVGKTSYRKGNPPSESQPLVLAQG